MLCNNGPFESKNFENYFYMVLNNFFCPCQQSMFSILNWYNYQYTFISIIELTFIVSSNLGYYYYFILSIITFHQPGVKKRGPLLRKQSHLTLFKARTKRYASSTIPICIFMDICLYFDVLLNAFVFAFSCKFLSMYFLQLNLSIAMHKSK